MLTAFPCGKQGKRTTKFKAKLFAVVELNGEMTMLVLFWNMRIKKPATIFGCVGKEAEEVDKYCMSFSVGYQSH